MFYKKKGIPEERDVVIVTVKKILFHSIFVSLDEYDNKEGMIHISEIAPGRIRNIRDYVKEGKKLVCLVLRINKEKGHIDLSLRRVPMSLRNKKNEEYKQEIKSEKLLEFIGKEFKADLKDMYKKMGYTLIEHFGLLGIAFNEIAVYGAEAIEELNLPKKEAEVLVKIVQEKIKPTEVSIQCEVILKSLEEDGVEDIRSVLESGDSLANKEEIKFGLSYISAPKYKLEVFGSDFKSTEEDLQLITGVMLKEAKKKKVIAEINRKK
jgi:translation initiation factor 2 subunit 1